MGRVKKRQFCRENQITFCSVSFIWKSMKDAILSQGWGGLAQQEGWLLGDHTHQCLWSDAYAEGSPGSLESRGLYHNIHKECFKLSNSFRPWTIW